MAAASALFHSSMRVGLPALKFFLGQDDVPEAEGDSGDEGEGGGPAGGDAVPAPSRAEVYKATQKVNCRHNVAICIKPLLSVLNGYVTLS